MGNSPVFDLLGIGVGPCTFLIDVIPRQYQTGRLSHLQTPTFLFEMIDGYAPAMPGQKVRSSTPSTTRRSWGGGRTLGSS